MTNPIITFFEKIGHELKAIFTSTTWEQKTLTTIAYIEPFVAGILTLADPAIEPIVITVIGQVTNALGIVKSIVQQGTVAAGSGAAADVAVALNGVKSNLNSLLSDAHIKNSAKVADITAAVDVVNGEVDAILADAPPSAVSA